MEFFVCFDALEFKRHFVSCMAIECTEISLHEPVSSQKYENGYRTKIFDFTVHAKSTIARAEFLIEMSHCT